MERVLIVLVLAVVGYTSADGLKCYSCEGKQGISRNYPSVSPSPSLHVDTDCNYDSLVSLVPNAETNCYSNLANYTCLTARSLNYDGWFRGCYDFSSVSDLCSKSSNKCCSTDLCNTSPTLQGCVLTLVMAAIFKKILC